MADFDICPDWVRPCEWPDLPTIGQAEEKVVGLVAVEDSDGEFLAVLCEGDYVVDWGDGSTPEMVLSGAKAEHQYIYGEISGEPICPDSSSSSSSLPGYKAVVVTITPSSGSSSSSSEVPALTKVDFQQRHSKVGPTNSHLAKWLDIDMRVPNCTFLSVGPKAVQSVTDARLTGTCSHLGWLQQFTLRDHSVTNFSRLFAYCAGLRKVTLLNTGSVTDTSYMFLRCSALTKVDLFDTSSVTTMAHMFAYCYALKCIPTFTTSAVNSFSHMFFTCWSLPSVPLLDTSSAVELNNMFHDCFVLKSVPLLDTSNASNLSGMFYSCISLREIPAFDTSSATNISEMFRSTLLLRVIPALDTSSVTNMQNLFYFCSGLTILPAFDCSAIPSTAAISNWFFNLKFIARSKLYGLRYSHSYRYSATANSRALTATALNEIFTNLGTAAGSQTITITGCLGAATCDRTIATAKGWTVAG